MNTTYIKGKRELKFSIEIWDNFPEYHYWKTITGYCESKKHAKEIWFYYSMVYKYCIVKLPKFN